MSVLAMRARLRRRRLLPGPSGPARWERLAHARPRRSAALIATLAGAVAWFMGGAVGASAAAAYAWLATTGLLRHRRVRRAAEATAAALDAAATLAADLRAGSTPDRALPAALPAIAPVAEDATFGGVGMAEVTRLGRRISTALAVSAATGAPLADLLDRLAADVSARERVRQAASAHAAGASATAWLLAALPLVGIAVGFGMGADPLRVLLHTRTGAVCALLALLLQVLGLTWSRRLAAAAGPVR